MTRFRATEYHDAITTAVGDVLAQYSLNMIRADDNAWLPELWPNVRACMDASSYGIAIFDQIDERDINPNVSLELGYMLAKGKRCLLLKEKRVPTLQADLLGHLYQQFDAFDIANTISGRVSDWLVDLGIAKAANERMVAFVSRGGTCRCAMAKAITRRLLEHRKVGYRLRVESLARAREPTLRRASAGARQAIASLLGEDLLEGHNAASLTPTRAHEADLILVMDGGLLAGCPPDKTQVFKPFFGRTGDVIDPWPDSGPGAEARYHQCAVELYDILDRELDTLVEFLRPSE